MREILLALEFGVTVPLRRAVTHVVSAALLALGCLFPAHADITTVRLGADGQRTRIVIEASRELTATVGETDANRFVVAFPTLTSRPASPTQTAAGVIAGLRWSAPPSPQLTVSLSAPARVSRSFWLPPTANQPAHRFVIDLVADGGAPATTATPTQRPRAAAEPLPRIVIDAGHGGTDPGAPGPSGVNEKTITLAAALELAAMLRATGRFDVQLIRETDETVALRDRVERALALGGDLFISLHADAGTTPALRGASVYTLSGRGESIARRVRREREWHLDVGEEIESQAAKTAIEDLVQRDMLDRAGILTDLLIPALREAGPVLENPHRHDEFFVLLNPRIPAVLVEMGFITNPEDERLLTRASGRRPILAAIARSVERYFDTGPGTSVRAGGVINR
jgi:N-acetylmuramoyl-L-alanine amidase